MTAPRRAGRPTLYALRPVEPANLLLGLFVLFVMQILAVAFWQWLVDLYPATLAGPVQPFVAAMACSLNAFITTVLSRPRNHRESLAACGAAVLSSVAVAAGVVLAALAALAALPDYSDSRVVQAFVATAGFWSGTPVIYGAVVRLGLRRIDDQTASDGTEL
ncbi:MAG: hypothetical protein JSU82_03445 [Rhodospirillales bacterium]|nr:MAG: hypothetical protein JSU82_03445 [Rhodospirillales bacterium]